MDDHIRGVFACLRHRVMSLPHNWRSEAKFMIVKLVQFPQKQPTLSPPLLPLMPVPPAGGHGRLGLELIGLEVFKSA